LVSENPKAALSGQLLCYVWMISGMYSLKKMIDESGLHPLTSLKSLSSKEKSRILDKGVVLCKEITRDLLVESDINPRKIKKVLHEAKCIIDCIE
jgi:hypothetical protein